uniref:Uncharacterized protein n=1 Tax=viral metagenome TaxID=1070528 RepID=A0A6H1ZCV0_9ZZZZ
MTNESNSLCKEHSGVVESLRNISAENAAQWKRIETMETKVDKILNRLTWAAIMFAFATIALIGNLIVGKF